MKKHILYLILITIIFPALHSQEQNKEILLLKDFIKLTTENNPEFKTILMDNINISYNEKLSLSPETFILSVESGYKLNLKGADNSGMDSGITIKKLFPETGTSGSITYNESPGETDYSSSVTLSLKQNIARDAFGKIYKLEKENIQRYNNVARFRVIEAYEDYLASLVEIYLKWYGFYRSLALSQTAYSDNLKLLNQIKEKRRMHIANDIDVNKARLQLLAKEENLIEHRNSYKDYTALIKSAIRHNSVGTLLPDREGLSFDFDRDFSTHYTNFEKNSRTCSILDELNAYEITNIDIKKQNLLPDISLFADYLYSGAGIIPGKNTGNELSFGINLSYDIDNTKEKALYETSLIDHKKTILESTNAKTRIKTELEILYNEIVKTKDIVKLYEQKSDISEAIVLDEKYQYSIGKSTLGNLLNEINTLDNNRYGKESATSSLNILIVRWMTLTDSLVK